MPKKTKKDEIVKFEIKKHHLYGAVGLLIGVAFGYLLWGATAAPVTAATAADPTSAPSIIGEATDQSSEVNDLASQIESLPRYEVPISGDDAVLGSEDAPITIVEFADFQCPYCQRHAQETYPRLVEQYGDQIRFVYKDFPLTSIHAEAFPAAVAGLCAQEQDAFWDFHDLIFSGRLELSRVTYLAYAEELGLDGEAFTTCIDDQTYAQSVQEDYNLGADLGVSSTPTFFINGIAVVGAQPFEVFAEIIDYELGKQPQGN
ncbi:MAG: DsbA family protein [Chloroflexi bacterium]|nr:DsbA family protein [Chloroflexota bacterium]